MPTLDFEPKQHGGLWTVGCHNRQKYISDKIKESTVKKWNWIRWVCLKGFYFVISLRDPPRIPGDPLLK